MHARVSSQNFSNERACAWSRIIWRVFYVVHVYLVIVPCVLKDDDTDDMAQRVKAGGLVSTWDPFTVRSLVVVLVGEGR